MGFLVGAFCRLFRWREGFLECWCRLKLTIGCAEWGTWNFKSETPFLGLKGVVGNFTDFESAGI